MTERPICPLCGIRPVDKQKNGYRKACWACRCDRTKHNEQQKAGNRKRKSEVIEHYGGKCECCGESEIAFLALDHINNDGRSHRKELGGAGGDRIYRWAKRNNFPNTLRLLCHNCNQGRHINGGICPHKTVSML